MNLFLGLLLVNLFVILVTSKNIQKKNVTTFTSNDTVLSNNEKTLSLV